MPIWKQFKNETSNKTFNGKSINFIEVDCEKDTKLADQFNVKGYPTIKLVNGNQIIEYDAKPDMDTLREFINTSL
jgi:thioredoxin-like negative regulator of GroEL